MFSDFFSSLVFPHQSIIPCPGPQPSPMYDFNPPKGACARRDPRQSPKFAPLFPYITDLLRFSRQLRSVTLPRRCRGRLQCHLTVESSHSGSVALAFQNVLLTLCPLYCPQFLTNSSPTTVASMRSASSGASAPLSQVRSSKSWRGCSRKRTTLTSTPGRSWR